MSSENWIEINGAKVNKDVFFDLEDHGLVIIYPPEEDYPWVGRSPPVCPSCRVNFCSCPRAPKMVMPLHEYVWDYFHGHVNPRRQGEVIHHLNENKRDARLKNLGKGTAAAHAKAHNERRRKFSPRKRTDFGGFRFHPRQPRPVIERPEMIGAKRALPEKPSSARSTRQQLFEVERRLEAAFEPYWDGMHHLDSGAPIPRGAPISTWRASKTRRLGLRRPRLCCNRAEATFVLMYIAHDSDLDAIAAELDVAASLLPAVRDRVSVSEALSRWWKYRRLPTVDLEGR